jgi:hypothetical protein
MRITVAKWSIKTDEQKSMNNRQFMTLSIALAMIVLTLSLNAIAEDIADSPEAQRFEAAKKGVRDQQRDKILDYIKSMRQRVQTTWRAPTQEGLEIRKVRVDLDSHGKVAGRTVLIASLWQLEGCARADPHEHMTCHAKVNLLKD